MGRLSGALLVVLEFGMLINSCKKFASTQLFEYNLLDDF
jgi:hypothetical protein